MSAYSARTPNTLISLIITVMLTWFVSHVNNTGHHPGLHGCQTLGLGGRCGDKVEDVDQHQEQRHQQGHSASNKVDKTIIKIFFQVLYGWRDGREMVDVPGTTSGGTMKDIQETTTNNPVGR